MGCCCSSTSFNSTSTTLTPLKKNSVLDLAQHMTYTKGKEKLKISRITIKTPMSQKMADEVPTNPSTNEDMKTVFQPPFNVCTKLTKNVFLSGIASLTHENIKKEGFTLIINATYEWNNTEPDGVMCIRVPVEDSVTDDISIYFDEVSDKIEENAQLNGKTLIHCMAGASRSTTLALAYLVKHEVMSLKNAFHSVRKRRECARPNMGFWDQLIKYEIKVKGKSSVKMIQKTIDGITVTVPDFYEKDCKSYYNLEIDKQLKQAKDKQENPLLKIKSEKQINSSINT
ncbi:dual specificity protein phosphatase 21-like [Oppia nitens]|uniref:dual specificity protein phosphatase 21-like n=1 Tax=Oppia nitens TaxID=1686743 RepID=UPI0023DC9A7B|nr:dual specificity protein phosphatase 21-like [Oppia nitens]